MNKILFLSFRWNDSRLHKHSSDKMMSEGFKKLGWDVYYYDYRDNKVLGYKKIQDDIYKYILDVNPDILFINKGESINPETIIRVKKNGFKGIVTGWYQDCRKNPQKCVINAQSVSDLFFHCKSGERLKQYELSSGVPSYFLFSPYNPEWVSRKEFKDRSINISWYGQMYDDSRFENLRKTILPKIKKHLDCYYACFGKKFIRGDSYYNSLGNSKMSVNIPAIDMEMYFSNRLSHIMGSGCVPLTYKFKGYDKIFDEGINSLSFNSYENFINTLNKYSERLEDISKCSLMFAERYMSCEKVAEEILYVIDNRKNSYEFK
jgi:hypothetical protein